MSNTTSPGTGYDFLPHYRQAIRLMREGQLTPAHYDHLVPLAWLLVDEIKKQIDKRPKATKGRLIESLRECLNEGPHAETVFRHTVKALENIPAEHDALYPLLRDTVGVIDDVLGGLLELLCTRYEGQLDGHIATHKKLVPVRELVKQYLPGFHPLNRQSVIAPQPLDTPAAFWKALRRMPMEVEWVNDSPCYTVPVYLLGYEDFNEDLRPLREAFEAALPKLKTKHLRLLHHDLSELLGIDRQSFRRLEALYN